MTPRFVTAWEREDYERQQRGEAARGPELAKAMARVGQEVPVEMSRAEINLRAALENSTSMMEAMMVQMHSWEIEPVVNVRGQMSLNKKLLASSVRIRTRPCP